jgi:hypothetical protein
MLEQLAVGCSSRAFNTSFSSKQPVDCVVCICLLSTAVHCCRAGCASAFKLRLLFNYTWP